MPDAASATHVAVDAGQTGIKIRVSTAGASHTETELPGVHTHEPVLPQLATAIQATVTALSVTPTIITVGTSGLTSAESAAALSGLFPFPARVVLTHDSVTSFLGALGVRQGAVVAAGTGVVTLAVGPAGLARVDGWGWIMGDAGSGYWIGREALAAVMRAHDHRGEATALTGIIRDRWPDLESAYIDLQSSSDHVRVVASFAADVASLADSDPVAARISDRAAHELALSVATAVQRAGNSELRVPVAAVGGVFRSTRVEETFARELATLAPQTQLQTATGTGLDGAELLAQLEESHPLHAHVSIADPWSWSRGELTARDRSTTP